MYDALGHIGSITAQRGNSSGETVPIDVDENFYHREKGRLFQMALNRNTALYNTIKFATMAARRNTPVRRAMLEAGALSLVLAAFVNADFQIPNLLHASRGKKNCKEAKLGCRGDSNSISPPTLPIPLKVIHAEASTLTVLIHNTTFRKAWPDESFGDRRYLCSLLVDSLLAGGGDVDHRYAWTRALFQKILLC